MFPERVILGSENYPKEIGLHWPTIEKTPWILGDFTWTAWDYIGEAGIGKATFYAPGDPNMKDGASPWLGGSPFPWRTANDSDFDITGAMRPQGTYRRIVWGSGETALFSYDPETHGKVEVLSPWGFPAVWESWTWRGQENRPVEVLVFSQAEEVELRVNGEAVGRLRQGEARIHDMPMTFLFRTVYVPGRLEAVSYRDGREVSRAELETTGEPVSLRLAAEYGAMRADGQSLAYVRVLLQDADGATVPDARVKLSARVSGAAQLMGFGSGNPVTDENYTSGEITSYRGMALAVLRAGYEAGVATLSVSAGDLGTATLELPVEA